MQINNTVSQREQAKTDLKTAFLKDTAPHIAAHNDDTKHEAVVEAIANLASVNLLFPLPVNPKITAIAKPMKSLQINPSKLTLGYFLVIIVFLKI